MKTWNQIYLASAIFALSSLILIFFLIYPTFADIRKGSEEILSNRRKTALIYMQNGELANFKKQLKDYESNLNKIDKLFFDPKNPVNFIEFLEKTSSDMNVKVDISLVDNTKKEGVNNSLVSFFQIFAKGNFQDILRLSEKLERGPYLIKISSLSISKSIGQGIEQGKEKKISDMVEANFLMQVINKQS